ncbi:MAG TPA: SDR family oxidoreductase [Verrucomicrobiae bacterium]
MRVLIIGCGYVGLPLGHRLTTLGHAVSGLRRSTGSDAQLRASGIQPIHADITDPASLADLSPDFDVIVNLVSSTNGGPEEYRRVYLEGTQNIIQWSRGSALRSYLYTSSTSVYAQADSSWVTEQSPTEPDSVTSQILIETERELLAAFHSSQFPATILRPSGIYGPGRGHLFKQFVAGEAVMRDDGSNWINMIHVDDLAAALSHIIQHGVPGGIYNVCDDEPVTQRDFFKWLAQELSRPMPPSAPADPARKRGLTNKRVANAKLKATGFRFTYPTFRDGYRPEIARVVAEQRQPPYSP